MSLATRCPACHTTFKVVQDQLKISEGWVRCGHCQEVFNALHSLFDLQPPAAPQQPPATPSGHRPTAFTDVDLAEPGVGLKEGASLTPPGPTGPGPLSAGNPSGLAAAAASINRPLLPEPSQGRDSFGPLPLPETIELSADPDDSTPTVVPEPPAMATADAEAAPVATPEQPARAASYEDTAPSIFAEEDPAVSAQAAAELSAQAAPVPKRRSKRRSRSADGTSSGSSSSSRSSSSKSSSRSGSSSSTDDARRRRKRRRKPEFMRQVERAAHWERPAVRAVLGTAATILALLLGLQMGFQWRDEVAARWPQTAGWLGAGCQWLGCQVLPPRSLERLVVDQTQLTLTTTPHTLRFTADVRNTATHPVRTPALEVLFSDINGQTLVRKVLTPGDLHSDANAGIGPDSVWHVDTLLQVGSLKITGYVADPFYP